MTNRYFTSSKSEPTLGWERLPIVGDDRRGFRERIRRMILIALAALWGGVAWLVWLST